MTVAAPIPAARKSFWRREPPDIEVSATGMPVVTRGGMFDYQNKWWDLPNFIKVLVTGYGGGKSMMISKRAISSALLNAPVWVGVASPTFPMAKRTIVPMLTDLLEGKQTLRHDLTFSHNRSEHTFTISLENRPPATIVYMSADNPDSMKGPNLAAMYADEPFLMEEKAFEVIVSRVRDPRAKLHEIGLGGTPEELNWGYELCEGALKDSYDVGYVNADTRQNKALDPKYAQRMLDGYDPLVAQAFVQGKFVNLSRGRVFYGFTRAMNVKEMPPPAEGQPWLAGMDFNVDPMAFCVGWRTQNGAHFAYEYELPNSDTHYAADTIRDHHKAVKVVYPDPSGRNRSTKAPAGQSDFTILTQKGFAVLAPHDAWSLRDSYNSVNMMLSSGRLTVHPRCKKLIHYLENYAHEKKVQQANMSHLLDAMRYAVTYMFPAFKHTAGPAVLKGH